MNLKQYISLVKQLSNCTFEESMSFAKNILDKAKQEGFLFYCPSCDGVYGLDSEFTSLDHIYLDEETGEEWIKYYVDWIKDDNYEYCDGYGDEACNCDVAEDLTIYAWEK